MNISRRTLLGSMVAALLDPIAIVRGQTTPNPAESANSKTVKTEMKITIGSKTFTAILEENPTAAAFKAMLPLKVKMTELNGNEKYYRLGRELPTNTTKPRKIEAGDLMLYGADTLVLFYKSFPTTYSYTQLGRIIDPEGLAVAVGSEDATVSFELI